MTQINLFEVLPTNKFRRIYGMLILLEEHKLVMKARGEKITFTSNYNIKEMLYGNIIAGFARQHSDNVIYPLPLSNKTHNTYEPWMARIINDPNYDIWEHPSLKGIMEELSACKQDVIQTLQNFKKLYDSDNLVNIEDVVRNLFGELLPSAGAAVGVQAASTQSEAIGVNVNAITSAQSEANKAVVEDRSFRKK